MKACKAACIGCGKCLKECKFEAITVENNLSYIDADKCRMCRKCEAACPTNAIFAINFPPRKPKPTNVETDSARHTESKTVISSEMADNLSTKKSAESSKPSNAESVVSVQKSMTPKVETKAEV